jgi:hypothetical protein
MAYGGAGVFKSRTTTRGRARLLRRELARVTMERDCLRTAACWRARRDYVSNDPAVPQRVSHPDDVPVLAGVAQRVLGLGDSASEWASPGACLVTGVGPCAPCRP